MTGARRTLGNTHAFSGPVSALATNPSPCYEHAQWGCPAPGEEEGEGLLRARGLPQPWLLEGGAAGAAEGGLK